MNHDNPSMSAAFVFPSNQSAESQQVSGNVQAGQGDIYVLQSCGDDCHIWAKLAPESVEALVFTSAEASAALEVPGSEMKLFLCEAGTQLGDEKS